MTGAVFDFVIIGSGFGGSVSAYRLSQKGYRVLVLEKGRRFNETDFSQGTSKPGRWIWDPKLGMRGIMKMTFLSHVAVMSGVGVGGGSLVYGATLPTPKDAFFNSGSWAGLRDWKRDLAPFYQEALRMLGAAQNPRLTSADYAMRDLAREIDREDTFQPTRVGIFFGEREKAGQPVEDPYFDGEGPIRRGCIQCGDCMTGCRHNAKNSLDKNYLYLAEKLGAEVRPETEVINVVPAGQPDGSEGYFTVIKNRDGKKQTLRARGVVFAGGVMGTVPLLLKLKANGALPNLSEMVGCDVRTNNESLTAVTAIGENPKFSEGIAIGSILHPDENSHLEPIRFGAKSGLWRYLLLPMATGKNTVQRLGALLRNVARNPRKIFRAWGARDFAGRTISLLFMQHLDSTVTLKRNRFGGLASTLKPGEVAPSADIPEANKLALLTEKIIGGKALRMSNEILLGSPATAHVLGGAVIGKDATDGVIDANNRVFNYENMFVCDGSAISANPGVNPSLSITALSEHAMSLIPARAAAHKDARVSGKQVSPEQVSLENGAGDGNAGCIAAHDDGASASAMRPTPIVEGLINSARAKSE